MYAISGDYIAQQRSVLRVEKKTEKLMEYFSGKLAERTTGARVDTMSRKERGVQAWLVYITYKLLKSPPHKVKPMERGRGGG